MQSILCLVKDDRLFSKVAPTYHRPTNRSSVAIKSEVSLRELPPGAYTLRARVTDVQALLTRSEIVTAAG